MIMSGQMLFEWLGRKKSEAEGKRRRRRFIDKAEIDQVVAEAKHLTGDLGGKASTTPEMGDAIAAAVRQ